jgi:5-methylcytosine-specific restriction endonuclease McrA
MASKNRITAKQMRGLVESQGYQCYFSGITLTPETASVDHLQPLSKGGEHTIENLAVVHRDINAAKGTMAEEEFIELCERVSQWSLKGAEY